MGTCAENATTDENGENVEMGWLSNISVASGSNNEGTSFEIMWDRHPNPPMMSGGNYMVVFRRVGGSPPPPTQTLIPVSNKLNDVC